MKGIKDISRLIVAFLYKVPILNALTLLMLLGELSKRQETPPFPIYLIYAHVFTSFVIGICLSNRWIIKEAIIIFCVLYAHLTYLFMSHNNDLRYRSWLQNKILLRMCGAFGAFTLLAAQSLDDRISMRFAKYGNGKLMNYISYVFLGIYSIGSCHVAIFSDQHHDLMEYVLGGGGSGSVINMTMWCLFLAGFFLLASQLLPVRYGLMAVAAASFLQFLLSDIRLSFWHSRMGTDWWLQLRFLIDSASTIACCTLFSVRW